VLAAIARVIVAAVFLQSSLSKALDLRGLSGRTWRPLSSSRRVWRWVLAAVAVGEFSLAYGAVSFLTDDELIMIIGLVLVILSAYGVTAIRRVGTCGCGVGVRSVRTLVARNVLIFLISGIPTVSDEPELQPAAVAAVLAVVCAAASVALVLPSMIKSGRVAIRANGTNAIVPA
jgi:Methylamine utilisation protein MauE